MSGTISGDPGRSFPLPEGVPDAIVNKGQLAEAFAVSENTVDKWLKRQGFPIVEGGSNGVAYQFRLSEVWAWREDQRRQQQQENAAAAAAVQQMRLALLNAEPASDAVHLSARERQEEYRAEAQYLVTARQRRELVPTVEVLSMLERLFRLVSDGLDSQPDRIARELGLDGAATESLVALNDDLIRSLRAQIEGDFLAERPDRLV